jgi:hypothetical protein
MSSRPDDLQERPFALILARNIRTQINDAQRAGWSVYWGERRVIAVRSRKAAGLWAAANLYEVQCQLLGCGGSVEWRRISPLQAVDSGGVLDWRR